MLIAFVLAVYFFFLPYNARAVGSGYGADAYGQCDFGKQCAAAIPPATMSNGLKIIINLANNQIISQKDGYDIVITQLGDSPDVSLQSAAISIDGEEVETVTPDESGTIRWHWDPASYPGTHIDVVVTASDGTTSSYAYVVKLAKAEVTPSNKPVVEGDGQLVNQGESSTEPGILGVLQTVVPENVKEVFRSLPQITINTFPYALIVVLGLVAIVILLQIRRELVANHKIMSAVDKEKQMIELKRNFLGLASHYLRTPATLIAGGIDLSAATKTVADDTLAQLKAAAGQLHDRIEMLITSNREATPSELPRPTDSKVRIGIGVVILAVIGLAVLFNLLAYASGRDLPALNLMTQAAVLVFVGAALYQIDRRLTLHRLERKWQDNILNLERDLQQTHDTFIEEAAIQLSQDYEEIRALASSIPLNDNTKPLHEGITRLYGVLAKCRTAQSLRGSHSSQQPVVTDFKSILDHSDSELSGQIVTKNLQLVEPANQQVSLREPSLIKYVAHSLIDNAVSYSPEKSTISLDAHSDKAGLTLTVSDKGVGIPKEHQELLFQPFSKAEGLMVFDHEGMGFDLYLDKLIMEYLGGSIELQSEENQGTTVNLRLPATA